MKTGMYLNIRSVITFAYHLGYQTSEIDTTLSHSYSSHASSKMKAFRIFEEWKANSKKPDDIMVKELEQALTKNTF